MASSLVLIPRFPPSFSTGHGQELRSHSRMQPLSPSKTAGPAHPTRFSCSRDDPRQRIGWYSAVVSTAEVTARSLRSMRSRNLIVFFSSMAMDSIQPRPGTAALHHHQNTRTRVSAFLAGCNARRLRRGRIAFMNALGAWRLPLAPGLNEPASAERDRVHPGGAP